KPIDIHNPQELLTIRIQIRTQLRNRKIQHRKVHGINHAGQGNNYQTEPFLPTGFLWSSFSSPAYHTYPIIKLIATNCSTYRIPEYLINTSGSNSRSISTDKHRAAESVPCRQQLLMKTFSHRDSYLPA